jgi:hypothetical protein
MAISVKLDERGLLNDVFDCSIRSCTRINDLFGSYRGTTNAYATDTYFCVQIVSLHQPVYSSKCMGLAGWVAKPVQPYNFSVSGVIYILSNKMMQRTVDQHHIHLAS